MKVVMVHLRNLSVRQRLSALSLLCVLAVASSVGVGMWAASRLATLSKQVFVSKDVVADILPPPLYLIEMRLVLSQMVEGSLQVDQAAAEVDRLAREYDERVRHWQQNPPHGLERELLGEQHQAGQQVIASARDLIRQARQKPPSELAPALQAIHGLYLAHRAGVDQTVKAGNAFATHSGADFNDTVAASQRLLWGTLIGAGLLTLMLMQLIGGSIVEPLRTLMRSIRHLAAGDLNTAVSTQGRDEVAALAVAVAEMRDSLALVVGDVRRNAEQVSNASREIAGGNLDLSRRTEQQASALQEIAATMHELSGIVQRNADQARGGSELAGQASQVAQQGGQAVAVVVQSMQGIEQSSRRIGEIISVIDGIAFQTNILALNAAVEAARAGEQGRGFAVVASEVRSLASRSAEAAKQIRSLISHSGEQVALGSSQVVAAGQTMTQVVDAIQQVNDLASGISQASGEQSRGVHEIGQAIAGLDTATQQNAALVEQTAAAAESLGQQARALLASVEVFRIEPTDHEATADRVREPVTVAAHTMAPHRSREGGWMTPRQMRADTEPSVEPS